MSTSNATVATVIPSDLVDRLGAAASTACAAHCLLVALLPATFAATGLSALLGERAELGFLIAAVLLAGVAAVASWRRQRAPAPLLAFAIGIPALLAARFMEETGLHGLGTAVGVGAGALLALGHVLSLRQSRGSPACEDPCHAPG